MAQQDMIPLRGIVDMVREFCTQRRTGTVFIVSDDNRLAQVHLESGNIVALLCRGRHGKEALAGIRTMQAGRLRFDANYLTTDDSERFDTNAILELLAGSVQQGARAVERAAARFTVFEPEPAAAKPVPAGAGAVTQVQLSTLEGILVQYMGPMAEIVCAEHAAQAGNLKALIAVLADELPDKAHATQFMREANRMLGAH